MGVELPLRVVVTILECCVTFSGVKSSIRSFVLFYLSPSHLLQDNANSTETDWVFEMVLHRTIYDIMEIYG